MGEKSSPPFENNALTSRTNNGVPINFKGIVMSQELINLGMDLEADRIIRKTAWERKKAKRRKKHDFHGDHDEQGAENSPFGKGIYHNERYQRKPRHDRNRKNQTMGRAGGAF